MEWLWTKPSELENFQIVKEKMNHCIIILTSAIKNCWKFKISKSSSDGSIVRKLKNEKTSSSARELRNGFCQPSSNVLQIETFSLIHGKCFKPKVCTIIYLITKAFLDNNFQVEKFWSVFLKQFLTHQSSEENPATFNCVDHLWPHKRGDWAYL